jgi:hypothetical protein
MDLGFGARNQAVGDATAAALQQAVQQQEAAVQDELDRFDALLDDETALRQLRERRLRQLRQAAKQREEWKAAGHGSYVSLADENTDVAKALFSAARQSERLVVHFYRTTAAATALEATETLHKLFAETAAKHLETRFVSVNVEDCLPDSPAAFLVQRLHVTVLPAVVCIRQQKTVYQWTGLDGLAGEKPGVGNMERLLVAYEMIHPTDANDEENHENAQRSSGSRSGWD